MSKLRVALLGATGESGSSILESLIESGDFHLITLTRSESLSKPANVKLRERGISTIAIDLEGDKAGAVKVLTDVDVLISAISPFQYDTQYKLADAAKEAGVKRFIPSAFTSVTPLGVTDGRDAREKIFNHIRAIGLPHTIIDVGWWYQACTPSFESGEYDHLSELTLSPVAGDGNTPSAITDKRDVGKLIGRIIQDERTINVSVFAYGEVWTPNEIFDIFDQLSDSKVIRSYMTELDLQKSIDEAKAALAKDPSDARAHWAKAIGEIQNSLHIRGDNTPKTAQSLGYLNGKELYPDIELRSFRSFAEEVVAGKGVPLYQSNERIRAMVK